MEIILALLALGGVILIASKAGASDSPPPKTGSPPPIDWSGKTGTPVVWDTKNELEGWVVPDCSEIQKTGCASSSEIDTMRLSYFGSDLHNGLVDFWVKTNTLQNTMFGQVIGIEKDTEGKVHIGVKVLGWNDNTISIPGGPKIGSVLDLTPAQISSTYPSMTNQWEPFAAPSTPPSMKTPTIGDAVMFMIKNSSLGDDYLAQASGRVLAVNGGVFKVAYEKDFAVLSGNPSLWPDGIPKPFVGAEFNLTTKNILV